MKVYFEDVEETMLTRRERKKRREHKKWAANFNSFNEDGIDKDDAEDIFEQASARRAHRRLRDQRRAKIEQFD